MSSVNKVTILGRLGKDPEVKTIPSGTQVATMSVATSKKWNGKDGQKHEKTEWHRCVLWDKLADLVGKYCKQGDLVYLEGELTTRDYEDKEKVKRYVTEISVAHVVLMPNNRDKATDTTHRGAPSEDPDVPF